MCRSSFRVFALESSLHIRQTVSAVFSSWLVFLFFQAHKTKKQSFTPSVHGPKLHPATVSAWWRRMNDTVLKPKVPLWVSMQRGVCSVPSVEHACARCQDQTGAMHMFCDTNESERLRNMQVSRCQWSVNCCVQAFKQTQRDTQGRKRAKCAHVGDTNNTPPHANRKSGVIQTSNRARVWQIWEARKNT